MHVNLEGGVGSDGVDVERWHDVARDFIEGLARQREAVEQDRGASGGEGAAGDEEAEVAATLLREG